MEQRDTFHRLNSTNWAATRLGPLVLPGLSEGGGAAGRGNLIELCWNRSPEEKRRTIAQSDSPYSAYGRDFRDRKPIAHWATR